MASEITDEYWTFKGRVASFQTTARRASNARGKAAKAIKWPHKFLKPEQLSEAGFYFNPTAKETDNVTCFLCHKSIVGWEEEDSPLDEHLKLSPGCGWALVASIQARNEELMNEDPATERMIEARRATFADRWPHENKKGWKCKTTQLVDAGWIYQPTPESDDWVMCTYCDLGLDGWEPADDPMEQHYKRVPECTFFSLINASSSKAATKKKPAKSRKPRASKASRLSTQSNIFDTTEAPSFVEVPAEADDSIVSTATVTSQAGRKMPKATSKKTGGRKTKAKVEEPTEVSVAPEPEDDDFEVKIASKPKLGRGKKRTSDAMDESINPTSEPPAPKRRATRTRGSIAENESTLESNTNGNESIIEAPEDAPSKSAPKKRGRVSKAKRTVSTASKASLRDQAPDDDALDAALMADLEKQLIDDDGANEPMDVEESMDGRASRTSQASVAPVRKRGRPSKITKPDHSMFGIDAMDIDDVAIEAELEAMQVEESQTLPKSKSVKAKIGRKPSAKQTAAAKKASKVDTSELAELDELQLPAMEDKANDAPPEVPAHTVKPVSKKSAAKKAPSRSTRASVMSDKASNLSDMSAIDITNLEGHDSGNETDASLASQSTVVRGGKARTSKAASKTKGSKKAASQNIEEIVWKSEPAPAAMVLSEPVAESNNLAQSSNTRKPTKPKTVKGKAKAKTAIEVAVDAVAELDPEQEQELEKPSVQLKRADTPPNKEATPSLSPQSSDAENQPPSSKPSAANAVTSPMTYRVPLAASTPTASPSKRNIIAGLQSTHSWTAIDLEDVFVASPNKENMGLFSDAIDKAKRDELSSEEKKMTVESWIQWNAGLAEARLKGECERMVGVFEVEGGRAMRALEGVRTVD